MEKPYLSSQGFFVCSDKAGLLGMFSMFYFLLKSHLQMAAVC
jgi:hypothetical protein